MLIRRTTVNILSSSRSRQRNAVEELEDYGRRTEASGHCCAKMESVQEYKARQKDARGAIMIGPVDRRYFASCNILTEPCCGIGTSSSRRY